MRPKQLRFVAEYLKDQNAAQAAIRAGYGAKNAAAVGARLTIKPHIKKAIAAALDKAQEKAVVNIEYVLRALKEISERCMQRVPVMEFDYELKELVQKRHPDTGEGLWEFDAAGANRSLELLGKHLKMFTDKVEHSGSLTLEQILGESRQ